MNYGALAQTGAVVGTAAAVAGGAWWAAAVTMVVVGGIAIKALVTPNATARP